MIPFLELPRRSNETRGLNKKEKRESPLLLEFPETYPPAFYSFKHFLSVISCQHCLFRPPAHSSPFDVDNLPLREEQKGDEAGKRILKGTRRSAINLFAEYRARFHG